MDKRKEDMKRAIEMLMDIEKSCLKMLRWKLLDMVLLRFGDV